MLVVFSVQVDCLSPRASLDNDCCQVHTLVCRHQKGEVAVSAPPHRVAFDVHKIDFGLLQQITAFESNYFFLSHRIAVVLKSNEIVSLDSDEIEVVVVGQHVEFSVCHDPVLDAMLAVVQVLHNISLVVLGPVTE